MNQYRIFQICFGTLACLLCSYAGYIFVKRDEFDCNQPLVMWMFISLNLYAAGCILGMLGITEITPGWRKRAFDVIFGIFCLSTLIMTAVGVVLMYHFGNSCEQNSYNHWILLLWIALNCICSE